MKADANRRHQGFTLVELLIVLVISAVLAVIALPSYNSYVKKSRRSDAITSLSRLQLSQEKYRANNPTYGTLAQIGASSASASGYYSIAVSDNSPTGYMLTATAVAGSSQASDTGCVTITLTQSGTTTTQGPSSTCWNQ